MDQCFIWKTPAKSADTGDRAWADSPRAGGEYTVTGSVVDKLHLLPADQKKRLTSWLVEQRKGGISKPQISSCTLDELKGRLLMSFTERVEAALLFIDSQIKRVGDGIAVVKPNTSPAAYNLIAVTECEDLEELQTLLMLVTEMKLLQTSSPGSSYLFSPTPGGWIKIGELKARAVNSSQAFVAMWFHESTNEPYENGLFKAIYDSGYDPRRIDQQHHHLNKVDDEIVAEIRRSRFLVADFTCDPEKVRGGVYFEAGFAMGLNIPIIWTCKDTSRGDLHFDTRQYPHILWKDSADLYRQLKARIGALLGDGPKRRT